ncbi:MAG: pentapeptide repeat-containing protein [Chloracidobacterium sp.]|nr:pentapeptide repeat-containing protein [Chloracidobacterium sp.]
MKREDLNKILGTHKLWVDNKDGGVMADLSRADLSGANLSRANLSGADLSRADLSGADLSGAILSRANLSRANLSRANLSGATLSGANLSGANLSRANISGADLSGANLSGADLSGTGVGVIQNLAGYHVSVVHGKSIRIGCQCHTKEEWAGFSSNEIERMAKGAVAWWEKNKAAVFALYESAKP